MTTSLRRVWHCACASAHTTVTKIHAYVAGRLVGNGHLHMAIPAANGNHAECAVLLDRDGQCSVSGMHAGGGVFNKDFPKETIDFLCKKPGETGRTIVYVKAMSIIASQHTTICFLTARIKYII